MEKVFFLNKKLQKLSGLLYPLPPDSNPVLIVVCHGFTGSKEGAGKAVEMARFLAGSGISTLLFDFAGCGESEGSFEDISLGGHIEDLESAVDFCYEKGYTQIITLGRSFGGSTAICQAPSDLRIKGVCTWAAPASLMDLFLGFTDGELPVDQSELVSMAGDEGIIFLKRSFFSDLSLHSVAHCASKLSPRPILVLQGTGDSVVPREDALLIYNSAGEPRELHLVEGADHQFSSHYRAIWDIFLEWVQKHFSA